MVRMTPLVVPFLLSMVVGLAVAAWRGIPVPIAHDEFGYLLQADTFRRGRLTNPTPPAWEHFDTIHVLMRPTYQAKFPPAQAATLALGMRLFGHPWAGVLVANALACAAIGWALLAWMPPRWATFGGAIAAFHPLVVTWNQSYFGGAMAAIGGALLLGAFRRIVDCPVMPVSFTFALGLAILASSRPLEGLVYSLPLGVALMVLVWQQHGTRALAGRVILLGICVLAPTAAAMGYYNHRVTGEALQTPYALHDATYLRIPHSPLFPLGPAPRASNPRIAEVREMAASWWSRQQTFSGWWVFAFAKLVRQVTLWWSLPLCILMVRLPAVLRQTKFSILPLVCVLLILLTALAITWGPSNHRSSPATAAWFLLVALAAENLYAASRAGKWIVAAVIALLLVDSASVASQPRNPLAVERDRIIRSLEAQGGDHLVLVRDLPGSSLFFDWVYNSADIASQRVIWARDRGQNDDVLELFPQRRIWLLRNGERAEMELLQTR